MLDCYHSNRFSSANGQNPIGRNKVSGLSLRANFGTAVYRFNNIGFRVCVPLD